MDNEENYPFEDVAMVVLELPILSLIEG